MRVVYPPPSLLFIPPPHSSSSSPLLLAEERLAVRLIERCAECVRPGFVMRGENPLPAHVGCHHPPVENLSVVRRQPVLVFNPSTPLARDSREKFVLGVPDRKVGVLPAGDGTLGLQANHFGGGGAQYLCDGDGRRRKMMKIENQSRAGRGGMRSEGDLLGGGGEFA